MTAFLWSTTNKITLQYKWIHERWMKLGSMVFNIFFVQLFSSVVDDFGMHLFVLSGGRRGGVCPSRSVVRKASLSSAAVFHGGSNFLRSCEAALGLPLSLRFLGSPPYFKITWWLRVMLARSLKLVLCALALWWVGFLSFLEHSQIWTEFFCSAFQADEFARTCVFWLELSPYHIYYY